MFVLSKHMLITLCIGLIGAVVFQLLHIPMPWLLGAITSVLIVQLSTNVQLRWHSSFRNFGLIAAGYSLALPLHQRQYKVLSISLGVLSF